MFIDDKGIETAWSPSLDAGRMHAMARHLARVIEPGAAVGLLFRSGEELVRSWFACINAGLRPLIVRYPTKKQSRAYWFDSVINTIGTAQLQAIISDEYCAGLGLPRTITIIRGTDLPTQPVDDAPGPLPDAFTILQLSSGTTGYRKAMEFTSADLRRHAQDYNQVLGLGPQDCIVSWLPLYHDMGYVACFVMPILLGIKVVMMDPVTWVAAPDMLFDAIARHNGSICYMPNFGFEVMSRAPARGLPSMRRWISCSEPVSASTAQKFLAHISAPAEQFSACYAMAENLFAVTIGTGYHTRVIDGTDVMSCGMPIPGVDLKTVDGEIWVRSPTSLHNYLGSADIRDADGYYATGDMGQILHGELYVTGRKQDVLIQAGRKFMLSDIDIKLNDAYPNIRGRAATLALQDDRLGTETPLILIEANDFFARLDQAEIAAKVMDLTSLDQLEVAYVPPRFLTKTSSGKINRRKTRADWLAVMQAKHRQRGPRNFEQELRDTYPYVDWAAPMKTVMDSLSMTVVKIMLETTSVVFHPTKCLNDIAEALRAGAPPDTAHTTDSIRIVSLSDKTVLARITEADLDRMGDVLGCKVTLDHICLPPSPVLLSDIIFHDYFQPRLDQSIFSDVDSALDRLKTASLILVDNIAEMKFLFQSTYPVLSHNLERSTVADLISVRWPSYTKQHHKLPITHVNGAEIPLSTPNQTLADLSLYLKVPIYRIASMPGFDDYCQDWEFVSAPAPENRRAETARLVQALTDWIAARPNIARHPLRPGPALLMSDMPHFCSIKARSEAIDAVVDHFGSFYILGQAASIPYLQRKLEQAGKPYVLVPSFVPKTLQSLPVQYECVVACGSFGAPPSALPVVAFQHLGQQWRTLNLGDFAAKLEKAGPLNDAPPSATDWFFNFDLNMSATDRRAWKNARAEAAAAHQAAKARTGRAAPAS
jgi:acyl-CoA synthetase (AMP-forming)/AMP-acid ligase II